MLLILWGISRGFFINPGKAANRLAHRPLGLRMIQWDHTKSEGPRSLIVMLSRTLAWTNPVWESNAYAIPSKGKLPPGRVSASLWPDL